MRKLVFIVFIMSILLLSGCLKLKAPLTPKLIQINKTSSEEKSCEKPYISRETYCCLDSNQNDICDLNEENAPSFEEVWTEKEDTTIRISGQPLYQKLDTPHKIRIDEVTYLKKGEDWGKITKIDMTIFNQGGFAIEPYLIIYIRDQPSDIFLKVGEFDLGLVLPNNHSIEHTINPIITAYNRDERNLLSVLLFDKRSGDDKTPLATAESYYHFTIPDENIKQTVFDIQKIGLKRDRATNELFIKSFSINFINGENEKFIPHLKIYKYDGITKTEKLLLDEHLPKVEINKELQFKYKFGDEGRIQSFVTHLIFRIYKLEQDRITRKYHNRLVAEKKYSLFKTI